MIDFVGYGVVMKNVIFEFKVVVKDVMILDNEYDGVVDYLEKYF